MASKSPLTQPGLRQYQVIGGRPQRPLRHLISLMDEGNWQATVHGAIKSGIRPKDFTNAVSRAAQESERSAFVPLVAPALVLAVHGSRRFQRFRLSSETPPPQPVLKPRGLLGEVDNCKRIVGWEFCPQLQKRTSLRGSPRAPQKSEVGRGRAQRS